MSNKNKRTKKTPEQFHIQQLSITDVKQQKNKLRRAKTIKKKMC